MTAGRLMPFVLVIGAFTFLYVFIPNTRVRFGPAFTAGTIGGALGQDASWVALLFGAAIGFYLQRPECRCALPGEPRLTPPSTPSAPT